MFGRLGALVVLAILVQAGGAQAGALGVYPIAGVYGLEQTACGRPPQADPRLDTALIAPPLCPLLDERARIALGDHFRARVGASFANVVTDLASQKLSGETAEARLSKTVIASLHLTRADLWKVDKPRTYDVYVPISLTLYLTNALTGEVMFVVHRSTIVNGQALKSEYLDQVRAEFPGQLQAEVDALVADAAGRFKPYAVSGKVRARIGDNGVFDVGRRGGVREGDLLGTEAKVVFSDANYSVIEPLLGQISVGRDLSRDVAQPVDMLQKPSALVVVADYPQGASRGYINSVFEDAVGADAGLAIAPVNASFVRLRQKVIGEAQLGSAANDKRRLPDYFIRLSVATLEPFEVATNIANTTRRSYAARAFVEVIDHSGRVVFAAQGADAIADNVTADIGFSPEQRRDTVVKNAVTEAAHALAKGFRPAMLRLPAKPAAQEVEIADAGGALGLGADAVVLRKSGGISGVQGDIWAPVDGVEVTAIESGAARARLTDPNPKPVRGGDQVAYESGAPGMESSRLFGQCLGPDGAALVDQRGAIAQPLFGAIALNSFAGAFRAPVQIAGFGRELRPYLGQFEGADRLGALKARTPDVCFQPVYQIDPVAAKGPRDPHSYSVVAGYALFRNGAKVAGSGLQETLKPAGLPPGVDDAARDRSLQQDLAKTTAVLTAQVARGLAPPN